MYTIFQYLCVVLKHIEIYTDSFLRKTTETFRKRPQLLLAAVILFASGLFVLKPVFGLEQMFLNSNSQNKPVFEDETLSEKARGERPAITHRSDCAIFQQHLNNPLYYSFL